MDAVVFHSHSVFNFPSCLSFNRQLNLRKFSCSFKDGPSTFSWQKRVLQLSISNTKSDGSRRGRSPRKSSSPGKRKKEDKSEKYQFSDGKLPRSPEKDEIIALFRRIHSSISKGEAKSTQQTDINFSEDKSPTESILEALRQSRKPVKGREQDRVSMQKRGVPKEGPKLQNNAQHMAAKFNFTRPPSKFIRRSPISSPSFPRGSPTELNNDPSASTESDKVLELPQIEEMKLPELKELAKSRGIKGYSKLKKGELLELLRS
ncbi:uncharacterized protein LOC8275157 [Ricinus communis]|uniref:uncharacterized protein LOC8275157 n=1 Tax=Ricinus communis TaxID=3988 RepID=UPI0007728699|nr:uncharacterized protein LOC8275157 [Ricinus communis]|eukprot:XP_015576678.1 uncharacterized protein LOC8275157 [Ricinus communis]